MAHKILLIIHDEVLATAYRARLARAGFELEHARVAHEGLATARRWKPDLILVDLMLPGLHGLDVLKWLRDVPWLIKIPVVVLIERPLAPEIVDECQVWGADSFLHKDTCSLQELVDHLHAVLRSLAAPTLQPSETATL